MEVPLTEAGRQMLLGRIAEAKAKGDRAAEAESLLDLAFIVKWAGSDNEESPFERSHTLALESLAVYEELKDQTGQIRALLAAAPFQPQFLDRAESLANQTGKELDQARVWAARARRLGLSDHAEARKLNLKAVEVFERENKLSSLAACYFSLAILNGPEVDKRNFALKSARCYRGAGDTDNFRRSLQLADMYSNSDEERLELKPLVQAALDASETDSHRCDCYAMLARIADAKGDQNAAAEYRRLVDESQTPHEEWEVMVAGSMAMIEAGESCGLPEDEIRRQRAELQELLENEPE